MIDKNIIEATYIKAVQGIKEEWFQLADAKWYRYIINLPRPLQLTYLVMVLHNQIYNGGFHQYFVNGYGQFVKETIEALIEIRALKKASLLKEAFSKVNLHNYEDKLFREKLIKKEINELFMNDELYDPLDKLDIEYYSDENEDIILLLENYLNNLNRNQ